MLYLAAVVSIVALVSSMASHTSREGSHVSSKRYRTIDLHSTRTYGL